MPARWRRLSTKTWCSRAPDAMMLWSTISWPSIQGYPCLTVPLRPGWRNEFHAGCPAGVRKVPGHRCRIHLEVHASGLRLQRAGQHPDHVSDRVGEFQDSRLRRTRQHAELPRACRPSWCFRVSRLAFLGRRSAGSAPRLLHSELAEFFASITTRISIPPLTYSTSPGKEGPGSASTGATIAALSQVRCPALAETAITARTGPIPSWTFPA